MYSKLTIRIHKESFRILKAEAAKLGLSQSELIRLWLENYLIEITGRSSNENQEKHVECKIQEEFKSLHPLIQENNLLLRKIARHTNAQIVIETDEQLKQLRKKGGS